MTESRHERIVELIAAYGADRRRWPAAERLAHEVDDAASQAAAREARELDALLDTLQAPPPPSALRREILLAVAREPRHGSRGLGDAWRELWRELGGARIAAPALVLAFGVGVGLDWAMTPPLGAEAESEDLLTLVQFEETYTELDP
jgi:hypothetical protein